MGVKVSTASDHNGLTLNPCHSGECRSPEGTLWNNITGFRAKPGMTRRKYKGSPMILEALHDAFVVLKWLFGLGALLTLLGIGLVLLWFAARAVVVRALRNRPTDRFPVLRKLFLDVIVFYCSGFPLSRE